MDPAYHNYLAWRPTVCQEMQREEGTWNLRLPATSLERGHIADEGNISLRLKSHWSGILNLCSSSLTHRLQGIKTGQRTQILRDVNSGSGLRFDTQIHTPVYSYHNFYRFIYKWFTWSIVTQQFTSRHCMYFLLYITADVSFEWLAKLLRMQEVTGSISEPEVTYPARYSSMTFRHFEEMQRSCHPSRDEPTLPHPFHLLFVMIRSS